MIKLILSEKSMKLASDENVYMFKASKDENKCSMARKIEELFSVSVTDVRVARLMSERRFNRRQRLYTDGKVYKKFYVKLKEGDKIDFFSQK